MRDAYSWLFALLFLLSLTLSSRFSIYFYLFRSLVTFNLCGFCEQTASSGVGILYWWVILFFSCPFLSIPSELMFTVLMSNREGMKTAKKQMNDI